MSTFAAEISKSVDILRMNRFFRHICIYIIMCAFGASAAAQSLYEQYIARYKDMAIEQMQRYGIPASITLAQGLLESGAGTSMLATKANNHFGIKVGGSWTGPYVEKDDDRANERFRKYRSAAESFEDHSKFLQQPRYRSLFSLDKTDYRGWAKGLKAAGYATNPEYARQLISIIEIYKLHDFDTGKRHKTVAPEKSHEKHHKTSKEKASKKERERLTYDYAAAARQAKQERAARKEQKRQEKELKRQEKERRKQAKEAAQAQAYRAARTSKHSTEKDWESWDVKRCNGVYYVPAQKGDTYAAIAFRMKTDEERLRIYNEAPTWAQPEAGSPVYLSKKPDTVAPQLRGTTHTVKRGESMHSIAQQYGVKMKALYKANKLPSDYVPAKGDVLTLP